MSKQLTIGNVILDNPFLFAPLAGITDAPTRLISREMGAAMVYSEMVSGKGLFYGDKKTDNLLQILEKEKPVAFQVFGSEPDVMAYTARELDKRENAILDVNMGCPVPKIVKNGEGSALMKNPDLIYDIVYEMVKNTSKPVTVKMRAGFDDKHLNAVRCAKAAESAGASAVAIHGRTREQYYTGTADWSVIRDVKDALSIPVIGNGDVVDGETGLRMLKETGCDFVMVGRGALGNPWIFRELKQMWLTGEKPEPPTLEDKKNMFLRHFNDLRAYKRDDIALKEIRKFTGWYFKGIPGSAALRGKVNSINDCRELVETISAL